jgi:hypothetical protein
MSENKKQEFNLEREIQQMCSIKTRYIILAISILIIYDRTGKLLFLLLNTLYSGFKTYLSLVKGEDYLDWFYYWMICLGMRAVESFFESALILLSFEYYFYIKIFICFLLIKQIKECEKIYGYFLGKITYLINFAERFNDSQLLIYEMVKNLKNLNKKYIK